jgi:NADPH2:quinone reductase
MKAIGYSKPAPLSEEASLVDIELPTPVASEHDLLVEVRAVSVNPVDYKVRSRVGPEGSDWKVIGYDAAGVVAAVGSEVTLFKAGDEVFYAGSIARSGTNAQYHLVDERIVGRKPASLDYAEAAALPLTTLTAWEAFFDRLQVGRSVPGAAPAILIVGGAGGVGSIAIQLARHRTDLTVIATASRPETKEWVASLGAHHVIDHTKPLSAEVAALGLGAPAFVLSTTHTDAHLAEIAELIAPQGRFAFIDQPATFDIMLFKTKSVSLHHELMFTRSLFGTPDMAEQGRLLTEAAQLIDAGKIRTTLTKRLSPINAANLKVAHALIESGAAKGKVVLEGWGEA